VGENRNVIVVAAALMLVAVAAGAGVGVIRRTPLPAPLGTSPSSGTSVDRTVIDVHVAGWVTNPGVVTVDEGSIVADAIAAAGGLRPGAAANAVNLAATLVPGQQVVVPGPESSNGANPVDDAGGLVSLNHATASDLETLPGVGPVLAERIVSFRESHGPFEQVEDLLEVPGIGEAKLASMRDLVQP
jgi:competence protein ComEA